MNSKTVVARAVVCLGMVAFNAWADQSPGRLARPHSPSQNLVIENTQISVAEFWAAYTSAQIDERQRAEVYLLGVLDATEGAHWCSYRRFATVTLNERVYVGLKKAAAGRGSERAAKVITEVLATSFPCRGRR